MNLPIGLFTDYGATMSGMIHGTLIQTLEIANTGCDGTDERTFRLGLRLGW